MPGHATSTSCRLFRDIHVAQGPGISYCTPSALCECGGQWFLEDTRGLILNLISHGFCECLDLQPSERCRSFDIKLGCVLTYQDRERHGCRARAYRDVLAASPGKLIHIPAPPTLQIFKVICASELLRRLVHGICPDKTIHPQRPQPCR